MIYVTGDTHLDSEGRFNTRVFPEQKQMTKEDFLIICGDFGGVLFPEETKQEAKWLEEFEQRPFTTLFVDGNHENHERLASYPVREWNGGMVHVIRQHVLHLMRGQVFTLQGKTFFSFGGAQSTDVEGGLLELDDPNLKRKKAELRRRHVSFRVNRYDWWKEELPSPEELEEGLRNLAEHGNTVDYIITHCCAASTQELLGDDRYPQNVLTDYFEQLKNTVSFGKWFFGHYHDVRGIEAMDLGEKETFLYKQLVRIV